MASICRTFTHLTCLLRTRLFSCFALPPTTHKTSVAFSKWLDSWWRWPTGIFALGPSVAKGTWLAMCQPSKCQASGGCPSHLYVTINGWVGVEISWTSITPSDLEAKMAQDTGPTTTQTNSHVHQSNLPQATNCFFKTRLFSCFALPPTTHKTSVAFSKWLDSWWRWPTGIFALGPSVAKGTWLAMCQPSKCQASGGCPSHLSASRIHCRQALWARNLGVWCHETETSIPKIPSTYRSPQCWRCVRDWGDVLVHQLAVYGHNVRRFPFWRAKVSSQVTYFFLQCF